ncbi:MAG: hypothetical protein E7L01_16045 [Paenibacillus macerans]|uniref:hypothetical protein n=1 Tax=Paenibacillus TaxID=44249 RepID=UPI000ED9DACB|nr:hypothetical protein [Paenibacillus macerans]MDU7474819.1 hypothetical protein [Paenibacillus macerans]MEC0332130.1 hypothetical protein [Paenibacillus macerans]GBK64430.1 hypothetical protein PbDSM24746_44340 [Paenibacillus macerans]GBK70994.1 hypothetical protein PbJCM17693_47020 [Paenibacillus macerans]
MNIYLEYGDTSFIGLVNAQNYKSFVNEDWELVELLQHFSSEMINENILVYQMTNEGIEHSWNIDVIIGPETEIADEECFRKAEGYIKVTDNKLYIVDYDCLTMSAQFEDEQVPDHNCAKNQININNGTYKVTFYQYYNVDENKFIGRNDTDIRMIITEISEIKDQADKVFWCTFY